jgi:hypothetical protein
VKTKQLENLKNLLAKRLKLDGEIIGLLVYSKGILKGRSFVVDVLASKNIR